MKKGALLVLIFGNFFSGFSQNEDDALRYSLNFFGGSARNIATAGSFSAVGGDYAIASKNPAGLAQIKRSNFSFSQVVENPIVNSNFYGTETRQSSGAYKISNISYLKAYNLDPRSYSNWYGVQMGLGYNRIHSFQESIRYTGTSDSSILHSFIKKANGVNPDYIYDVFPFDAGLAYDTYALDPGPNNTYVTDFNSGSAIHDRTVNRIGGMGEYSFVISGNYANKLYVGGTLNFTRIKYNEMYEHRENYTDTNLWIRDIRYLSELDIKGWGYGIRVGAIYLPVNWLRIGLSVQTPTIYNLSDKWSANMFTDTDDGEKYVDNSNVPYGSYDYKVQTPLRSNVSLGVILKKFGSVGLDVEYVDYSNAVLSSKKFNDAPYSFTNENFQIQNIYRPTFNVKVGAEYRIKSQYYVRAGFANYGSPYKANKGNTQYPTQFFTGGFGYNFGSLYLDVAMLVRRSTADYYAYDPTIAGSLISLDYRSAQYVFTLGYRFE